MVEIIKALLCPKCSRHMFPIHIPWLHDGCKDYMCKYRCPWKTCSCRAVYLIDFDVDPPTRKKFP